MMIHPKTFFRPFTAPSFGLLSSSTAIAVARKSAHGSPTATRGALRGGNAAHFGQSLPRERHRDRRARPCTGGKGRDRSHAPLICADSRSGSAVPSRLGMVETKRSGLSAAIDPAIDLVKVTAGHSVSADRCTTQSWRTRGFTKRRVSSASPAIFNLCRGRPRSSPRRRLIEIHHDCPALPIGDGRSPGYRAPRLHELSVREVRMLSGSVCLILDEDVAVQPPSKVFGRRFVRRSVRVAHQRERPADDQRLHERPASA